MSDCTETPELELRETVRVREIAQLIALGQHASTIRQHPSTTIRPSAPPIDSGAVAHLMPELAEGALEIKEMIGEGGMAIVSLAAQRSVGRAVAVKALRPEHRKGNALMRLLREAWVTASLEHPNVPPVHDVVLDRELGPLIVLKRIEGVSWRELMFNADVVRARFEAGDVLEFNLEILMQVCRAVHFAHSRGIVHRDIKPSNVMIGSFGEVYLLDWGIAVSLRPDPEGRLPSAADARGLAGTPCYMSPEMLDANYAEISERTDIYLLGAVLYEIVMGHAPHGGEDVVDMVCSIIESRPSFADDVPEELRRIAERAMDPAPAHRFQDAEEVRQALSLFLRHRQSARIAAEAESSLADLRALLASSQISRERVYKLFGACRFGLQEALRSWPDNEKTRALLHELFARTIEYELASDNAQAAAALLAEVDDLAPELRARVEDSVVLERQRRADLEHLERDLDPRIGRGARRAVSVGMGVLWTVAPLLANLSEAPRVSLLVTGLLVVLALLLWLRARELKKTAINRRILVAILVGFGAHGMHLVANRLSGYAPGAELAMSMVSFGAIAAILAHTADRRLWPLLPLYWLGAVAAALQRDMSAYILSGCNLVLTLYLFAIWRPERAVSPTD